MKFMEGLFDLNIEQVLENWSISDAIREIIANAIDEQILTGTDPIEIVKDDETWHIRDFGRGIQYMHFTQNEDEEKLQSNKLIGKFGVGLKDALAVLYRHHCNVLINSKYNTITTKMAYKTGFEIQTLHADFHMATDPNMIGTDFAIIGISDKDMEDAKNRFLMFNNLNRLEITKYGEIYALDDKKSASIYINGVKIAQEDNFMFNYNITSMNVQIRKALNRERSNVGRTAYTDTIKNILKASTSSDVLNSFITDLKNRMYGTNKDETSWVDVAAHVAKTLNKKEDVVFITPLERSEMSAQQVEILNNSGKKLVMITDDVYNKISGTVETFSDVYRNYNESFKYNFISYEDLSTDEKYVFNLGNKIMDIIYPKFKRCSKIKISETIRVNEFGDNTVGIYEDGTIIIKRSVLRNAEHFCSTLAHELCHHQHNFQDNTRAFESDLTNMLGYSIYKLMEGNIV